MYATYPKNGSKLERKKALETLYDAYLPSRHATTQNTLRGIFVHPDTVEKPKIVYTGYIGHEKHTCRNGTKKERAKAKSDALNAPWNETPLLPRSMAGGEPDVLAGCNVIPPRAPVYKTVSEHPWFGIDDDDDDYHYSRSEEEDMANVRAARTARSRALRSQAFPDHERFEALNYEHDYTPEHSYTPEYGYYAGEEFDDRRQHPPVHPDVLNDFIRNLTINLVDRKVTALAVPISNSRHGTELELAGTRVRELYEVHIHGVGATIQKTHFVPTGDIIFPEPVYEVDFQ